MKYINKKALEQISILFQKTTDELEKEIQNTSKEEWIGFALDIETPTYLKQVKKYGKSHTSGDEIFSFSIYMDNTCDFKNSNVIWNGQSYDYFPNPQIDYGDIHINMHENESYIAFDTNILADCLQTMVDFEDGQNIPFNFKVYICGEFVNEISFEQMKEIVDNFSKNQGNENAVSNLMESFKEEFDLLL